MKTLRFPSFFICALFACSAFALHADAAIQADSLIKNTQLPDVYYVAANGKRYVFPNQKTFATWYADFSSVKTVSDTELASASIGGAVTYRPGVRLVKVTTDPKVYAVAKNGTLRWIQTENVAAALYGTNWNQKIDDLPDAFFATYHIGTPIATANDFSPSMEMQQSSSISIDKLSQPTSPPAPMPPTPSSTPSTTTGTISIVASKSSVQANDLELLTASATHPTGIASINIFLNELLVETCTFSPCVADTYIPQSDKTSHEAKAVATAVNGQTLTTSLAIPVSVGGVSPLVQFNVTRSAIKPDQLAEAISNADVSIAVLRTDIYLDGVIIEACATSLRECRWSDKIVGALGSKHDLYAVVTDTTGKTYSSIHKTITLAANDSPFVSIQSNKAFIYSGEYVDVTVTVSDDDMIASIEVFANGQLIKTCSNVANCTAISGPWTQGPMTFTARAVDNLGASETTDPITVTVQ